MSLTGPSGCGKSTLLQLIGAAGRHDAGSLHWCGRRLRAAARPGRVPRAPLGFVFQSFHLMPTLSALDNVQLPMFERGWSRAERRERAEALLAAVGVAHRQDKRPPQLSGGERQPWRLRGHWPTNPTCCWPDEPTGSLDSTSANRCWRCCMRCTLRAGSRCWWSTHDAAVAAQAARTLHMLDGRIVDDRSTPWH